jgi:hypothetical protein
MAFLSFVLVRVPIALWAMQNVQTHAPAQPADSAAGACIDHILFKIKILRNL